MTESLLMTLWIVMRLDLRGDPGILRSSADLMRMEIMRRIIVNA